MAVNITTGTEVNVAGGPTVRLSETFPVDAYDLIDVPIADGAADQVVEVQPAAAAGQIQFLLVSASEYDANLTYKVNDPANPPHALDRSLILTGSGAVALLGFAPENMLFSNATGGDITVQILVGREATP